MSEARPKNVCYKMYGSGCSANGGEHDCGKALGHDDVVDGDVEHGNCISCRLERESKRK